MYKQLFERGKIGSLEIKNRIFKPAAQNIPGYDGYVSEKLIRFYEEEARGGVGLIMVGLFDVSPHEKAGPSEHPKIENDNRIKGLGSLAQAIQDNGAVACCQLAHFGSHAWPAERCVSRDGLETEYSAGR